MWELKVLGYADLIGTACLIATFFLKPRPRAQKAAEEEVMASKFVSVLDHIGDGLKKFFTSPLAAGIEQTGINIAALEFPALAPFLNGLSTAIAKAQTLAKAANPTGDTTAQVVALAAGDAQDVFTAYEQATGAKFESATQQNVVGDLLSLLDGIPASSANPVVGAAGTAATTATGAAPSVAAPAAAPAAVSNVTSIKTEPSATSVAQETPGAAVETATQNGPGLHNVVPQ
jgi:hypothetical protein